MKFLISTNVEKFRSALGDQTSNITFCQHNSELAEYINGLDIIDVWLCNGNEVTEELLNQWLNQDPDSPKTLLVQDEKFVPDLKNLSKGRVAEIHEIPRKEQDDSSWAVSALQAGERLYARSHTRGVNHHQIRNLDQSKKQTVLVVGAGIMNLVAAEHLAFNGFQVRVVDANPDPRTCKDWTRLGATHGGGDARMFTFTEADSYNEMGSNIYQDMRHIFRKTSLNGGWSVKSPKSLSAVETAWVKAFEQVPTWLAKKYKEDVYSVNREAGKLWPDLMARAPELFEGVSLNQDILRLYAEDTALEAANKLNQKLGTIIHDSSQPKLVKEHTGFDVGAKSYHLAGGLTVKGFTLSIHSFVKNLIGRIVGMGGEFIWDCSVNRIRRNASGQVTMLESEIGPLQADNFVISTGVTRNGLLDGTASENIMQGVLGVWLQIPNVDPMLKKSAKIHRRGCLVEDINITVGKHPKTGEDTLTFGGGYGYVGLSYPSPDSPEMQALFNELEQVARIYCPAGYQLAKERGTLWPNGERKFCIRPFTCTGLGVFEDIPTANGGHLIITGGNNTGGFAQAPAIARAISRAMAGEHDPIHVLFNPYRSQLVDVFAVGDRYISELVTDMTEEPVAVRKEWATPLVLYGDSQIAQKHYKAIL